MNRADKNWAQFQKIKYVKNKNVQKNFLIKAGLLVQYSPQKIVFGKIQPIFNTEKDFENQNSKIIVEVVHNIDKSDSEIIW